MERSRFENLDVYKLSERLSDGAWLAVGAWDHFDRDTVGRQLVRSADSIGANIAESVGRGSYLDNRRFVLTARGSLYETNHWLRRAFQRKLLTPDQIASLRSVMDELTPRLNAYLKSIPKLTLKEQERLRKSLSKGDENTTETN